MNKIKLNKKTLTISILVITLFSIGIFLTKNNIFAGDITGPSSVTASLYTLTDIYNRLTTNDTATAGNHSLVPSANPASTFHSLTDIYEAIPTIDASKVLFGTSYLGVAGTATTTVSTLCYDNTYYYNDLSSCSENYACDSVFNGTYTADGIVVNEGTCETGDVCYDGSNYYSNMSSCSNGDDCDSDVSPTYVVDGEICNAVCVVDSSLEGDEACCSNANCASGECVDNVCASAFDPEGSVSGYAQYSLGGPAVSFANPYNAVDVFDSWNSCSFTVDEYSGAVAYYIYYKNGTNTLPTSNDPADWTGWGQLEEMINSGTFGYELNSDCACEDFNTYFIVAKSSGGDYTVPVGVRVEYYSCM